MAADSFTRKATMALFDGTSGRDTLYGSAGVDRLQGHGGSDLLYGLGGDDVLVGGAGSDTLHGDAGNDTMDGGGGHDRFFVEEAGDRLVEAADPGLGGIDTVESTSLASYVMPVGVENLLLHYNGNVGGRIVGNDLDNHINDRSASNVLLGGKGNDTLLGNAGGDVLDGGSGADLMIGGTGSDVYYFGRGDRIQENLVDAGRDLVMSWIDITLPYYLNDVTLIGTATIANGNNEENRITGNALNNLLQGGQGNDELFGMDGDDTIVGGKGRDVLTGGNGNDTFKFTHLRDSEPSSQRDILMDLRPGDKMDFSLIDANVGLAGDQAFTHVAAFTGQAGQLTLTDKTDSQSTWVSLDANGDRAADFILQITGQHTSSAGWVL